MALEYINESSILKDKSAIREFKRYLNDPHDITSDGAKALAKGRDLAKKIKDSRVIVIE
ncbi:hypothetical protein [Methanocella conradii]|uniref:hypothetical protein n=1 Tax=Methanocella conradii TaxID=1175444 RepID=UPI0024B3C292|nr:hypothetical protein [Methanocella conradii]MDI6895931.1 hypothetical protein [Methanocella conradii]